MSGNDLLQYWAADERTDVVALHLQSFGNPRKFTRIARSLARAKPVVAVKSGRTRPAARPGSGDLAASWPTDLTEAALLAQSGVIRVDTAAQLFDVARVLSSQPVPAGRRVAVVSNARGASVLAADACIGAGLETPASGAATVDALPGQVPEGAQLANPFELTWEAGPDAYRAAVAAVLADDAFDAVMVLYAAPVEPRRPRWPAPWATPPAPRQAGDRDLPRVRARDEVDGGVRRARVPLPERGRAGLGRLAAYGEWLARPAGTLATPDELGLDVAAVHRRVEALLAASPDGRTLEHAEAADLLRRRPPRLPDAVVADPGGGRRRRRMGFPVVLKATGSAATSAASPAAWPSTSTTTMPSRPPSAGWSRPWAAHGAGDRAEGRAGGRRRPRGRPAAPRLRRGGQPRARRHVPRPTPTCRSGCCRCRTPTPTSWWRVAGGGLLTGATRSRRPGRRSPTCWCGSPPCSSRYRSWRAWCEPRDRRARRRVHHRRLGARGALRLPAAPEVRRLSDPAAGSAA